MYKKPNIQTICVHPPVVDLSSIRSELWCEVYFPARSCVITHRRCLCPSLICACLPSGPRPLPPPLLHPLSFPLSPSPCCFYMTLGLEASCSSVSGKQTDSSVCRRFPKAECSQWLFIRTKSLTQISIQQTHTHHGSLLKVLLKKPICVYRNYHKQL